MREGCSVRIRFHSIGRDTFRKTVHGTERARSRRREGDVDAGMQATEQEGEYGCVRKEAVRKMEVEPDALNLGAGMKHIGKAAMKMLSEARPCKETAGKIVELVDDWELQSNLEQVMLEVVMGETVDIGDGGVNFKKAVPVCGVFYGACKCNACSVEDEDVGTTLSSRKPKALTAGQLNGIVMVQTGMRAWTMQADRFVEAMGKRESRKKTDHFQSFSKEQRKKTVKLAKKSILKVRNRAEKMTKLRLNATKASIRWAIVRIAVKRWKIAHYLFEAKQGPSYGPGGAGEARSRSHTPRS